jgi:DNA repair protein RadC
MDSPDLVQDYLRAFFAGLDREVFAVMFLDVKRRLIELKELFRGTVAQVSVYPREVVKEALYLNASAVVLIRTDVSGHPEPRRTDVQLTERLRTALLMVDVHVFDHVVVGGATCVSLAERGWL